MWLSNILGHAVGGQGFNTDVANEGGGGKEGFWQRLEANIHAL
jgi:hypothetical protein